MKKLISLMTIMMTVVFAVGCSSDNDPAPVLKLEGSVTSLEFDADGGEKTFTVTAENVKDWKITSDDWIKTTRLDDEANTVKVELDANTSDKTLNGKITLSATGVNDFVITVTQPNQEKNLSADKEILEFMAEGGEDTFTIIAQNVEWTIDSDEWIEWEASESNPKEIIVKLGENPLEEIRSGKITLSATGVEDFVITVTQAAAEPKPTVVFWERSTKDRMNLHGNVHTVSYYDNIARDEKLQDLTFNEDGMLVSYTREKGTNNETLNAITYDAEKRITKISATGNKTFEIIFEYGSHGNYIPVGDVLNDLGSYNAIINHNSWVPALIKNISAIKFGSSTIKFNVDGESGNITYDGEEEYKLTFKNNYIDTFETLGGWSPGIKNYTLDYETGHILKIEELEGGEVVVTMIFNQDNANTLAEVKSVFMGDSKFTYNDNLDIISFVLYGDTTPMERTYEYDSHNNWIKAVIEGVNTTERTITYR